MTYLRSDKVWEDFSDHQAEITRNVVKEFGEVSDTTTNFVKTIVSQKIQTNIAKVNLKTWIPEYNRHYLPPRKLLGKAFAYFLDLCLSVKP